MHQPQQDVGAPFVAAAAAGSRPATPATAPPRTGDGPAAGWTQCHTGRSAGGSRVDAALYGSADGRNLVAVQLGGPLARPPGSATRTLDRRHRVQRGSSSTESWVLAAGGIPRRSVSRWYLDPGLPGSVGFGPVSPPPLGAHAHAVQAGPRALLRLVSARQADAMLSSRIRSPSELVERDRHPLVHRLLDREFVAPASQVWHQAMGGDHDPGAAILLAAPHRTEPCLQPTVIAFDPVIGVSVGAMPGRGQQFLQHDRGGGCLVGDDLHRGDLRRAERPLQEPAGSGRVAPWETNTSMTWPAWSIAR